MSKFLENVSSSFFMSDIDHFKAASLSAFFYSNCKIAVYLEDKIVPLERHLDTIRAETIQITQKIPWVDFSCYFVKNKELGVIDRLDTLYLWNRRKSYQKIFQILLKISKRKQLAIISENDPSSLVFVDQKSVIWVDPKKIKPQNWLHYILLKNKMLTKI